MIHLLQVSPKLSLKELKKLSRRYAMTGGFEIGLDPEITQEQLKELAEIHLPELQNYSKASATYRSNNSYRILALIQSHPLVQSEVHDMIKEIISDT